MQPQQLETDAVQERESLQGRESLEERESVPERDSVQERESDAVVYEMMHVELPRGGIDLKDHMSAIEIGLIRKALEEADGTVAGAARLLRIRRTTLVEKLRKYRLSA